MDAATARGGLQRQPRLAAGFTHVVGYGPTSDSDLGAAAVASLLDARAGGPVASGSHGAAGGPAGPGSVSDESLSRWVGCRLGLVQLGLGARAGLWFHCHWPGRPGRRKLA